MCSSASKIGPLVAQQLRLKQGRKREDERMAAQTELRSQPVKPRGSDVTGLQIRG